MKTALIISGQPHSWQKYAAGIIDRIIIPNNADVFIHAWSGFASEKELYQAFKPKDMLIETQKDFVNNDIDFAISLKAGYAGGAENPKVAQHYTFSTRSMWYSIKKAFDLISPEDQYDCVIKARFDLGIGAQISCKDYDLSALWAEDIHRPELVNNWMNFSNYAVMEKYSLYNKIQNLYDSEGIWCNEYWIKKVMDQHNISVKYGYWGLTIENTDIRKFS